MESYRDRILGLLGEHPGSRFDCAEIAAAIGCEVRTASNCLGSLCTVGKIERVGYHGRRGIYQIAGSGASEREAQLSRDYFYLHTRVFA